MNEDVKVVAIGGPFNGSVVGTAGYDTPGYFSLDHPGNDRGTYEYEKGQTRYAWYRGFAPFATPSERAA